MIVMIVSLMVAMVSISWAQKKYYTSHGDIYWLVFPVSVVTLTRSDEILDGIERVGRVNETRLKQLLQKQILPKAGIGLSSPGKRVQAGSIKKIIILPARPADKGRTLIPVILLENEADEPQAIAVSDPGAPADKRCSHKKAK